MSEEGAAHVRGSSCGCSSHAQCSARIISAAWIFISRSDHTFYTGASAGSLMQLGKCINDLLLEDASCGIVLVEFRSNGR